MGIRATCIGAWPKPGHVELPDWFNLPAGWLAALAALGDEGGEIIARGVAEAVHDQAEAFWHDTNTRPAKASRRGCVSASAPARR